MSLKGYDPKITIEDDMEIFRKIVLESGKRITRANREAYFKKIIEELEAAEPVEFKKACLEAICLNIYLMEECESGALEEIMERNKYLLSVLRYVGDKERPF